MARPRRPSTYDLLDDGTVCVHLTGGTTSLIDSVDIDLTDRCWGNKNGYVTRPQYNGKPTTLRMHRIIAARIIDRELQAGEVVDHVNGKTTDNRRFNLRVVTQRENSYNRIASTLSSTGFKGVHPIFGRSHQKRPYAARITLDGRRRIYVAYCATPIEAAWMYDQFASQIHGEYAKLNFEYV